MPGPHPTDHRMALRRSWAKARLLFHSVHDLGLPTIGKVVTNSFERRREARDRRETSDGGPRVTPGRRTGAHPIAGGMQVTFENATLSIEFRAADVVCLWWEPGLASVPYGLAEETSWRSPAVEVTDSESWTTVTGGDVTVRVGPDGDVEIATGQMCRRHSPPTRRGERWELRFAARPGEHICGLGEQSAGVDLRGGTYRLWNRDPGGAWGPGASPLYMNVPVLLGVHDEGSILYFFDNSSRAVVEVPGHDRPDGDVSISFACGQLRMFAITGAPGHLLDRYSELTGRPAMPPRWALGYHQSRWGYKKQGHVDAVIEGYRSLDVPLSAVHLDIDYMDGYRVFTVDRRRFPDMKSLSARAARRGTRLVAIVDPAVKVDDRYDLYRQGRDGAMFCTDPAGKVTEGVVWPGRTAFPDFTSPRTRQWWSEQYIKLTDAGISGIWHDMNEPTSIALAGDPTLPLDTRHDLDGQGGDHRVGHNVYGLEMNRAGHDGLRRARPGLRPFIVSRSGWAGNQRYCWNWTGDVQTSWESLRQQVASLLGMGLSGIAFAGPDIGGFSGVPDDELYLRWLQMSAFLPFFRTHSVVGAPPREPWRFRQPTQGRIADWIRFRYRLLPYLYTLAHEAVSQGAPVIRPLWWPEGSVAELEPGVVDDAFLLGHHLLVAPVTAPAARSRPVALPPGRWVDLWSGQAVGGDKYSAGGVPERIPVFVRSGSVVPLDDGWAAPGACALPGDSAARPESVTLAEDHHPLVLAFHCWPQTGAASGDCFDDAGDGDGPGRADRIEVFGAEAGGSAVVRWHSEGAFARPSRVRVVMHGLAADSARADGVEVEVTGSTVDCGAFEELTLEGLRQA